MNILHVCAEFFPLIKTGGLADVTGALPIAEQKLGHDVRILIPGFPAIKSGINNINIVTTLHTFAGTVALKFGYFHNIGIYFIDAPSLYEREGSPYHDYYCNAYMDNYLRFALLSWVGCEIACGADSYWRPNVVHSHDWHAGLTSAYLQLKSAYHGAKSLFTIHNLAYHGCFSKRHLTQLQLPEQFYQIDGLEFNGEISYLKAGIYFSDHVTTVSPTYAKEITTPELGYGFDGILRQRYQQGCLTGVLNGIDESIWNPRTDPYIAKQYNARGLTLKNNNKQSLQQEFGLEQNDGCLLFGVISRLTSQKGLDFILPILPYIIEQGGQFILLGSGDQYLQDSFVELANRPEYRHQLAVYVGYDEELSHRIIAGSDIIMVPSRFEPCGLTQLYGLKYGTLPLVRQTGGLADTVVGCCDDNLLNKSATGFTFRDDDGADLTSTVTQAFECWHNLKAWRLLQQRAMKQEFSWQKSAKTYLTLYQQL